MTPTTRIGIGPTMAQCRDRALAAARAGRTVAVAVTFTITSANITIRDTLKWRDGESAITHLLLTMTLKSLPVGDAAGWPELHTAAESDARHFSCHKRGGVYAQPANLDVEKLVRHENIASRAGERNSFSSPGMHRRLRKRSCATN